MVKSFLCNVRLGHCQEFWGGCLVPGIDFEELWKLGAKRSLLKRSVVYESISFRPCTETLINMKGVGKILRLLELVVPRGGSSKTAYLPSGSAHAWGFKNGPEQPSRQSLLSYNNSQRTAYLR